jgi:predicted DNA-binding transcriptional regulator
MSKENEIKRNSGISDEAFKQLLIGVTRQEADRSMIISLLRIDNERTVGELATATDIPQKQIIKQMIALMKRGSVAVAGEKGGQYVFTAVEPPE